VIGRVFQELRLIELWGSGIQRMMEACLSAGLPVCPRFEEIGTHFRVTIFSKRVGPPLADETDGKILGLLAERGPLSIAVIAKEIGLSARATLTRLRNLLETGQVFGVGKGPNDPRREYAAAVVTGRWAENAAMGALTTPRARRRFGDRWEGRIWLNWERCRRYSVDSVLTESRSRC